MLPKGVVTEKNEEYRDILKHREIDNELINLYWKALNQLKDEDNPAAKIAYDYILIEGTKNPLPESELRKWVWNIHNNTWSETSFAGIVKARVIVLRISQTL